MSPARAWLRDRVDREAESTLRDLVRSMTETAAVATANAVTVRALSPDGEWLMPVAAHHPEPGLQAAMAVVMDLTAQRADSGLWGPVLDGAGCVRYRFGPGGAATPATPEQRTFLDRYPVTAVMGVALFHNGDLVGAASLVQFVTDRDHTDEDEALLTDFGLRAALVLGALRKLGQLETVLP